MDKPDHQGPGGGKPPGNRNGNGVPEAAPLLPQLSQSVDLARKNQLIELARQIIEATPEVRPEKIAPIIEALDQDAYDIDVQKLANILIEELILKR